MPASCEAQLRKRSMEILISSAVREALLRSVMACALVTGSVMGRMKSSPLAAFL